MNQPDLGSALHSSSDVCVCISTSLGPIDAADVGWENNPYMEHWNEVCAWTVEHMGLPGDRYRTEITKDYMIWYFIQPEDQLVMTLAWGNDNGTDI